MPPAISNTPATLSLRQQLTRVSGTARIDGKEVALEDVVAQLPAAVVTGGAVTVHG